MIRRGRLAALLILMWMVPEPSAAISGASPPASCVTATTASAPASVLVLYPDDRLLPANILFDDSFRQTLVSESSQRIDCFSEFLDEVHFPAHVQERMRDFVTAKYDEHPPSVIVAFAPASLDFCLRHRSQLFPDVPIVFAALGTGVPDGLELLPHVTGVRSSFDAPATLRLALRLHPRTQHIYIIEDSAVHGGIGMTPGQSTLRESEFHSQFHHLESQPGAELLKTLSLLPENSLVLIGLCALLAVPQTDSNRFGSALGDEREFVLEAGLLPQQGKDFVLERLGEFPNPIGLQTHHHIASKHGSSFSLV